MRVRSLLRVLSACLCVLVGYGQATGGTIVRPIEASDGQARGIVLVQFRSGGHLDAAARGLAVVDQEGRGLPHRLLEHDPEGRTSLAVDLRGTDGQAHLHYGRKPLPEAVVDEAIPVSLVMRTFTLPEKAPKTPDAIVRLVRTATPQGTALICRIFHAHNPFGSDKRFITDIQGLLDIHQTDTYHLFSTNDDDAYVYIDGKLVIGHDAPTVVRDAGALARQATPIHLEKGLHTLRYIHVQRAGQSVAMLGYVTGEQAQPLPPHFFVHHHPASLGPAAPTPGMSPGSSPGQVPIGFDAVQSDQLAHGDHVYTRFRLLPIAPPPEGRQYRWRFDDGTSGRQPDRRSFEHVFVSSHMSPRDRWRVTLELTGAGGKALARATSFLAPVVLENTHTIRDTQLLRDYTRAIGRSEYPKATVHHMTALYNLVKETEQPALIAPLAESFVDRFRARGDKVAIELKYTLATHLARDQPQRAADLYGQIARAAGADSWRSTCAAAEQLDLFIFRLGRTDNLERRIAPLLSRRPAREIALLKSRLGDLHRIRGNREAADEAYRKAQVVAYRQMDPRRADVLQAAYRETADAYLTQERWPALRDVLFQWEADFPTAKLGGDLPLLTGLYFQAVGDDPRAIVEFQSLLKLNPLHPSRPEILHHLARSLETTGRLAEAREMDQQLAEEYPKSPFVRSRK